MFAAAVAMSGVGANLPCPMALVTVRNPPKGDLPEKTSSDPRIRTGRKNGMQRPSPPRR
jgi:hypothetical protein